MLLPPRAPEANANTDKTLLLPPKSEDKTVQVAPPSKPLPPVVAPLPPAPKHRRLWPGVVAALVLLVGVWAILQGALLKRAERFSRQNDHTQAAATLRQALMLYPLHPETYLVPLGRELRLAGDLAGSQKSLEQALQKIPASYAALVELGRTFVQAGDKPKALESFQKALQIKADDYEVLRLCAELMFDLKNYDGSAAAYEKITKSAESTPEDRRGLGAAYVELGKWTEAEGALKAALEKNPGLKGLNILLARTYAGQGRYEEAAGLYKSEAAASPSDTALTEAFGDACRKAGETLFSQKKFREAAAILQDGLSLPSQAGPGLHYGLAVVSAAQKKNLNALSQLEEAVKGDASLKNRAAKDPSFAKLRKWPRFRKIVK